MNYFTVYLVFGIIFILGVALIRKQELATAYDSICDRNFPSWIPPLAFLLTLAWLVLLWPYFLIPKGWR